MRPDEAAAYEVYKTAIIKLHAAELLLRDAQAAAQAAMQAMNQLAVQNAGTVSRPADSRGES